MKKWSGSLIVDIRYDAQGGAENEVFRVLN